MSIATIITAITALQAEITGIKKAHNKTPDSLNEFPCFVNIIDTGDLEQRIGGDLRRWRHVLKMQLRISKADMPSAETTARTFIPLVVSKFDAHIRLNDTCARSNILGYQYGTLPFGAVDYLGISFDLEIWEDESVVFA